MGPPAFGVWNAQPARSVYSALGRPQVRKTSASAVMTAPVVSPGQSWA